MKDLLKKKEKAFPYLMCLPALLLFTLFITLPFINGLWISFPPMGRVFPHEVDWFEELPLCPDG